MSAIRVTAMLCITVLVIITGVMVHSNSQDRYIILPQNNAMFIFDRKTSAVNYCTADQCRLVMPYGSTSMPRMAGAGANPAMMMSGGGMQPQGFQPYVAPGMMPSGDNSGSLISTSMMGNPIAAGNNNPMMMWAYMQAASAASSSAQKGGFSSLQSQPSWMNMMAMMQPTSGKGGVMQAQSPIVPVSMQVGAPSGDGDNSSSKKGKKKAATAAVPDGDDSGGEAAEESSGDDSVGDDSGGEVAEEGSGDDDE